MNENPHTMSIRSFTMWQPPPPSLTEDLLNPFSNPRPPFFAPPSSWVARKGRTPPNRRKNPESRRFARRRFSRFAPFAPRNTTSFIIRAKRSGGIASQASPYPVTPAILPTPQFSPSREGLVDMAKEEWGVDGYGSMKGLIRLRSPIRHEEEYPYEGSSDGSDVEEHVEVERRLDQDLSRFEMIPNPGFGNDNGAGEVGPFLVENWVGPASHVAELVEENLTLRERLFLIEREMGEMKNRLLLLEARFGVNRDHDSDSNDQVLDEGAGDLCSEEH